MTTRGIFALVLLTTACSSTTAAYYQDAEVGGTDAIGVAGATSSAPAAKVAGVNSVPSGGSSTVSSSGPEPSATGGTTAFSTTVALHDLVGGQSASGGSQARTSLPEQLTASGGSDAAGGSASGGSSARMLTPPAGAAGIGSVAGAPSVAGAAGSSGAAGMPQYYSPIDEQVHPITDTATTVYDYDRFIGINCGTLIKRPYDLCEPIDTSLPPGDWKWRAKRVPGNPLISACLSAGDAACGRIHMADVCGNEVLPDGTCGPNPHVEPICDQKANQIDAVCWRICLDCTDSPGVVRAPNTCPAAKSALTSGMTCPTY